MNKGWARSIASWLVFVIAVQGISPALVYAAQAPASVNQPLASAALAAQMGVDPAWLSAPADYQARAALAAQQRRAAALAALDTRYGPSPAALAALDAAVQPVKRAQVLPAFRGLPAALADLDALVASAQEHAYPTPEMRGALARYQTFVALSRAQLAQVEVQALAQAEGSDDAIMRTTAFFAIVRQKLQTLADALAAQPESGASSVAWQAYLAQVRDVTRVARTDLPDETLALTALPVNTLHSVAGRPQQTALDYALVRGPQSLRRVLSTLGPSRSATMPATPVPGDLAETPDVHFTAEVQALVTSAGGSPVALFNYVHDQVDSELYYGSKKGSTGTLYELAGNDMDQASLLLALYRRAGIPARYAIGRVWLSAQQAQDLTRTTDTHAAADVLTSAGIPAVYVARPSGTPLVEIEHTWVEAWLPYEQYRGELEAPGLSNWIALDPFIKRYAFNSPVDLRAAVAFDPTSYLSVLTTTLPLDLWENALLGYVQAHNLECKTLAAAMRGRTIVPAYLDLLPAELPVIRLNTLAVPSALTGTQRYSVNFTVRDAQGNVDVSLSADLPVIYGQRIALTFPAASAQDQALLDHYGGLFNTPPYLVNLRPTLSISETTVASGQALHPGALRDWTLDFNVPGLMSAVQAITHHTQAGGVYVAELDYQTVPQRLLDEASARAKVLTGESREAQDLHVTLLRYFRALDHTRDDVTGVIQAGFIRDLGAGFAARQIRVTGSYFGAPVSVAAGAHFMDVPKLSFAFYDLEGGQARAAQIATLVGYQSSALEHTVLQQVYGEEAVSAVKALQIAVNGGQPLYVITSPSQVAGLGVGQAVKDALLDALNRGWLARSAQNAITYHNWSGVGYIVYDPLTGSAGYLISGALNGGSTAGGGAPAGGSCGQGASIICFLFHPTDLASLLFDLIESIVSDPINLTNGNLLDNQLDLAVEAPGLPVAFDRWYNSLTPADGRLGWGWTDSFSRRIVDNGDGSRSYVDSDGHVYLFASDGGSGFVRPPGYHFTLTQTGSGYTLRHTLGGGLTFDTSGRMLTLFTPGGTELTLVYSGAQLVAAHDAAGATALTFTYNGTGRLSDLTDRDGRHVQYAYDGNGHLTSVTDATNGVHQYAYDALHRLTRKTNALGQVDLFVYDGAGRAIQHIDPLGQSESFSYDDYNGRAVLTDRAGHDTFYSFDADGRVVEQIDALGNRTVNTWDADNNLRTQVDPRGHTRSATYDANGNIVSAVDVLGQSMQFTYNAQGQVINRTQVVSGTPEVSTWGYDPNGNVTTFTDALSHTTTLAYDSYGQLTQTTDPSGATTTLTYNANGTVAQTARTVHDADGNPTTVTTVNSYAPGGLLNNYQDGSGRAFSAALDAAGHVQAISGPGAPNQLTMQYDAAGHPIQIHEVNGVSMTLQYDGLGRLVQQRDQSGSITRIGYNPTGQIAWRSDARGQLTRYGYDALGRLVRVYDADGGVSGLGYCAGGGEVCASVDALGNTQQATTDALGQIRAQTDASGHVLSALYDEAGHVIALTDGNSRTTQYQYDATGHLLQVVDALNQASVYSYNTRGALTGLTDALGRNRAFTYDELGRLTRASDAAGRLTRYFYDGAGRRNQVLDPNGASIGYTYDSAGRLASTTGPSGTTSFTRDAAGRVTSAASPQATFGYTYDASGALSGATEVVSGTSKSLAYTYDADHQLIMLTDAEGRNTSYSYDALKRLSSIVDPSGGQTTFAYDARGQRTRVSLPNGVTTYYAYDAAGALSDQVSKNADGLLLAALHLTYDNAGHRVTLVDQTGQSTTYTYDALYRLTAVTYGTGRTQSFTYDAVGNRLTQTVNGVTTTYTYDVSDRLLSETTSSQTTTYTYDNNGNLVTRSGPAGVTTYVYNHNNQVVRVNLPGGARWDFGYNADQIRVSEKFTPVAGPTQYTNFLLVGSSLLADYAFGGVTPVTTRYLRGPETDEVLAVERGGTWTYFVQDPQGNALVATNAAGQVSARRTYDAFGALLSEVGVWSWRVGFAGRDALGSTGLVDMRARAYDPAAGRFTSVDPAFGHLGQPETLHRYGYVKNDPIELRDPSGADFYEDVFVPTSQSIFLPFAATIGKAFICTVQPELCIVIVIVETIAAEISALVDVLFKYDTHSIGKNVAACACAVIVALSIVTVIIGILAIELAPTPFDVGEFLVNLLGQLATQALQKLIQVLGPTSPATGSIVGLISNYIAFTVAGTGGFSVKSTVAGFFLAPEVAIGSCALAGYLLQNWHPTPF